MSLAAQRETTKVEDLAYNLIGILDVDMPLLYGEVTRAFQRLQKEIFQETVDLSLFTWQSTGHKFLHRLKTYALHPSTGRFDLRSTAQQAHGDCRPPLVHVNRRIVRCQRQRKPQT